MFCARSRPTNKGNREQKPVTKKLAEFHNQFVLLTMVFANVIIHLSVGEKPSILVTSPHSRLSEYPGLFTSTSVNNCSLAYTKPANSDFRAL